MRKGNKSKLLIAVLTLALALNAFGVAVTADEDVEPVLEFEEILSDEETAEEIEFVEIDELNEADEIAEEELAEEIDEDIVSLAETEDDSVRLMAESDGQTVSPGTIFVYNNTVYRVKETATNIVSGGGGFDTAPTILESSTSTRTDNFINSYASYNSSEGHSSPGCLEWSSGVTIWRHYFESGKLYIYSMWYKFTGTADLNDNQRHLAGAKDVATGEQHYNLLTNDGTETWQQDWCVFEGDSSEEKFLYAELTGSGTIYIDDFYIYEVEEYDFLDVKSHQLERQSDMQVFDVPSSGIPSSGEYYHVINYETFKDYTVTGVVALMKDGKLVKIYAASTITNSSKGKVDENGSLIPAAGTVDIWFEVPELEEGESLSQYSYMAYIVSEGNPFGILDLPGDDNPVTVVGVK